MFVDNEMIIGKDLFSELNKEIKSVVRLEVKETKKHKEFNWVFPKVICKFFEQHYSGKLSGNSIIAKVISLRFNNSCNMSIEFYILAKNIQQNLKL